MEPLTLFIFAFAAVLVIFVLIFSCFKVKKDDVKEKEKEDKTIKYDGLPNVNINVKDGKVVGVADIKNIDYRLRKTFNFQPIYLDAVSFCPSLKKIENPKAYYTEIYKEYFAYTDFSWLESIVKDADFKTLGFEKLDNYLRYQDIDFDFSPKIEDIEALQKTLNGKGLYLVDSEKLLQLAAMKCYGFGCKRDLKAGFYYLQFSADLENERAMKFIYPFSNAFGGDFDLYALAEIWESLWLLKRGDKKALEKFAKMVLLDFEAQYFTADEICFDFALQCAEKAAEKDPSIWYKLAAMLMYYDEFEATDEQKNVVRYLNNAVKHSPADRESAKKDLEVWGE